MTEERDPYAVLGIPAGSTAEEVATAYRNQARRHHPDVSADHDAEQRMAEINTAWGLLRDPAKRAAWDRAHGITPQVARRRPSPAADADAGSTRPAPTPSAAADPPARTAPPARPAPRPGTRPPGPSWRRGPAGEGAAGPPPGNPRGSILPFGRHIGWSLGEIARIDPGYLAWLHARREGAPYRAEIDRLLAGNPATTGEPDAAAKKRRLFR